MTVDDLAVAAVRAAPFGYFKLARLLKALRPSLGFHPTKTRYGTMYCDIAEIVCLSLVRHGENDRWDAELKLFQSLADGKIVIDVGANIGVTTKIFAQVAREVHAFEPAPRALRLLRGNADPNVTVYPMALSDFDGVAQFAECDWLDFSSLADEGIDVPVRTLDSFGFMPDLIKIDVENFEPQVLRGAQRTLEHGPAVVFEALDEQALKACQAELPGYSVERISDLNYLATR